MNILTGLLHSLISALGARGEKREKRRGRVFPCQNAVYEAMIANHEYNVSGLLINIGGQLSLHKNLCEILLSQLTESLSFVYLGSSFIIIRMILS